MIPTLTEAEAELVLMTLLEESQQLRARTALYVARKHQPLLQRKADELERVALLFAHREDR